MFVPVIPFPSYYPIIFVLVSNYIPPPNPLLLPRLLRCQFKSTMRIPKKPVSFGISLLFTEFSPTSFISLVRFTSGILGKSNQLPQKSKAIHSTGSFYWRCKFSGSKLWFFFFGIIFQSMYRWDFIYWVVYSSMYFSHSFISF